MTRRILLGIAVILTAVAALFFGVFPTEDLLDQRSNIATAEQELSEMDADRQELTDRIAKLEEPAEIERLAREAHRMVYPGEEAYAILPPQTPELDLPDVWPFDVLEEGLESD